MPQLSDGPIDVPYSGKTTTAELCSLDGARRALVKAGSQAWKVFFAIKLKGELTDHEIQSVTGLPLNVVNRRRRWLVKKGLVRDAGKKIGPAGIPNTLWEIAA